MLHYEYHELTCDRCTVSREVFYKSLYSDFNYLTRRECIAFRETVAKYIRVTVYKDHTREDMYVLV